MIRYFTKTAIFKILPALALSFLFVFSACEGEKIDPNNPYDPNTLPDPHFSHRVDYEKDSEERPIAHITCVNTSAYSNRWIWYIDGNVVLRTTDHDAILEATYSAATDREVTVWLDAYYDFYKDDETFIDTLYRRAYRVIKIEKQQ